jgi:hypothetical protein
MGSRDRLRHYFLTHLGEVIDTDTLADVAGTRAYARRIRDLLNEEGYRILTSRDRPGILHPGQYLLEDPVPHPAKAAIAPADRNRALSASGYLCSRCGLPGGAEDPTNSRKRVSLHVVPAILSTSSSNAADLVVLCTACKSGYTAPEATTDEDFIELWRVVRRAPRDIQLRLLEVLEATYRD